jgi:ketosteroid isomerase-like protein
MSSTTHGERNVTMNAAEATIASELPEPIGAYLAAHRTRAVDEAVSYYTADATVVDEGNTYRGPEEIGAWLSTAASEYTFTTELTGSRRIDDEHYVATHHLEGNFPGGVADLQFKFTLRDGRISQLTIEP